MTCEAEFFRALIIGASVGVLLTLLARALVQPARRRVRGLDRDYPAPRLDCGTASRDL
jgi:hypothetical protein